MEEDDGDALVDASSDMDQGPMEAEGEDALIATLSNADQGPEQNSTPAVHIGNRLCVTKRYNADQNGVFYEYLPKRTINAGGVKTVWVPCGGKDKERSTAMLLGDSEGNKYPLFIVLMQTKSTIATTLRANINDRNGFGVFPIGRDHIVEKATQMSVTINDVPRATTLSFGWYKRFLDRHSHLKVSKARVLSKPRNAVVSNVVVDFFHELAHDLSLVNVDPSRIFNMGETNFSPTKTSKKVVVHRNTKAVYAEESSVPSHVTIVACVAADGTKVLPLFILPGEKVSTDTCDKLTIPGAALTTSEKGWTSSFICRKWLSMLDANIPASTMRPILLILDGCSSHYSEYIYPEATALNILLQFLPANATHLFQPLNVSVFRPFKQAVRNAITDTMWTQEATSITKQRAIEISWNNSSQSAIVNGFV
ncbi:hypothetical protein DYB26_005619 [Aphanomyces astaci]|uniref:DDE-1 domain-containing protein n=1 Tax=Aphanomyces astaci TaxID=112090 RepID=A0A397B3S1_APHAT|nr:hypothetical protein DYB36_009094 [Aphanomyces astaci]RHY56734.1 hypothetical protein DYB34_008811 [Aphanomyces astaci]RHZ21184.1 hypothetical protein DYB31_004495 [Aphanomyces astaci]RHZ21305.1 hypothetical protein DYB26_005619 [Aphanomyces astaci]